MAYHLIQKLNTLTRLVKTATNMNTELLLLISNGLTGLAAWFAGKRRTNAETDNQVLRNLELSVNIYVKIIEDLKGEIHELNIKVQELEKRVNDLMAENRKLKNRNGL